MATGIVLARVFLVGLARLVRPQPRTLSAPGAPPLPLPVPRRPRPRARSMEH